MPYDRYSWSRPQAAELLRCLEAHGKYNWNRIAADIPEKTAAQTEEHFIQEYPQPTMKQMINAADERVRTFCTRRPFVVDREGTVQGAETFFRPKVNDNLQSVLLPDSFREQDIETFRQNVLSNDDDFEMPSLKIVIVAHFQGVRVSARIPVWDAQYPYRHGKK